MRKFLSLSTLILMAAVTAAAAEKEAGQKTAAER